MLQKMRTMRTGRGLGSDASVASTERIGSVSGSPPKQAAIRMNTKSSRKGTNERVPSLNMSAMQHRMTEIKEVGSGDHIDANIEELMRSVRKKNKMYDLEDEMLEEDDEY